MAEDMGQGAGGTLPEGDGGAKADAGRGVCPVCGRRFDVTEGRGARRRYCSARCKERARAARKRARESAATEAARYGAEAASADAVTDLSRRLWEAQRAEAEAESAAATLREGLADALWDLMRLREEIGQAYEKGVIDVSPVAWEGGWPFLADALRQGGGGIADGVDDAEWRGMLDEARRDVAAAGQSAYDEAQARGGDGMEAVAAMVRAMSRAQARATRRVERWLEDHPRVRARRAVEDAEEAWKAEHGELPPDEWYLDPAWATVLAGAGGGAQPAPAQQEKDNGNTEDTERN